MIIKHNKLDIVCVTSHHSGCNDNDFGFHGLKHNNIATLSNLKTAVK